jgi:hypothetical protein
VRIKNGAVKTHIYSLHLQTETSQQDKLKFGGYAIQISDNREE